MQLDPQSKCLNPKCSYKFYAKKWPVRKCPKCGSTFWNEPDHWKKK